MRFAGSLPGDRVLVSLDGVDDEIQEPSPFNRAYFSHKFNGPALSRVVHKEWPDRLD